MVAQTAVMVAGLASANSCSQGGTPIPDLVTFSGENFNSLKLSRFHCGCWVCVAKICPMQSKPGQKSGGITTSYLWKTKNFAAACVLGTVYTVIS